MPCFQGLAVSIHTPEGPIAEHSIQKQGRRGRITTYIPVPEPQLGPDGTPQQSTFAVSITLLTPGLRVPYSAPKPTPEHPYPQPAIVDGLPASSGSRGAYGPAVQSYKTSTGSANETVAAYIYFDGRQKEEVATLLRRGEETWVNSRWVSIPDSEGGGIAEREFLFREVGLERWLNGLDLSAGADKAAKIRRRQAKLEKKRRIKLEQQDSDEDDEGITERKSRLDRNGVLRYGGNANAPVEAVLNDEDLLLSDHSSDDEPPEPEASGQIKVALFRVLASGEIKRGEYSPQFDVHDDEGVDGQGNSNAGEDVDHTTSFAKPKSLDPKSISTQTVTGLDPPDAPFCVFTFFYRGQKQLQKMGILPQPSTLDSKIATPANARRKSKIDYANLAPLTNTGTKGFSSYRDKMQAAGPKEGAGDFDDDDAMDSDDDSTARSRLRKGMEDDDEDDEASSTSGGAKNSLNPEDAMRSEEVAEGVRKIKLKRQHSSEINPLSPQYPSKSPGAPRSGLSTSTSADSPTLAPSDSADNKSASSNFTSNANFSNSNFLSVVDDDISSVMAGSPLKKQRSSIPGLDGVMQGGGITGSSSLLEAHGSETSRVTASGSSSRQGAFSSTANHGSVSPLDQSHDHHGMKDANEVAKQSIAAATALPDEDEEL